MLGEKDKMVLGEEAMEEALKSAGIIVADPLYRPICPGDSIFMNYRMWHFRGEYILRILLSGCKLQSAMMKNL